MKKKKRGGARPGAGRPATGRTGRPVSATVDQKIVEALDAKAEARGISRNAAIVAAIKAYVKR